MNVNYYLPVRSSKARTAGQNEVERDKKKENVYFLDVSFPCFTYTSHVT